jgi:hypothetical protein
MISAAFSHVHLVEGFSLFLDYIHGYKFYTKIAKDELGKNYQWL